MRHRQIFTGLACLFGAASGGTASRAADLTVVSVNPTSQSIGASLQGGISVSFDQAVKRSTVDSRSFWAFGRWSGTVRGPYSYSNGDRTVTLTPQHSFSAGESVMVVLSHDLQAEDGSPLRSAGYSYQFWTAARPASLSFSQVDEPLSTRFPPDEPSRAYGGLGADLNQDGYPDLTIINEITADLRVFLNRADGTGRFHDFLRPTSAIGYEGSPSEVSDFDRDGQTDICVSNADPRARSVSILLGRGDGTFGPQQEVAMGGIPRGIAVLDVDGDGDIDILNGNQTRNQIGLLLNDGQGVFGAPTFFASGGNGPWALGAADMNGDGKLDLVSGAYTSGQVAVHLGNGDASFTQSSIRSSGGSTWMLVTADLDADGQADVALVNNSQGEGAILLGNGQGALGAPQTHDAGSAAVASDLGDLDGDGDLDWVTASYGGGLWRLFANDGAGSFTKAQDFQAPAAASCSSIFDLDRDGDLDLILIDEVDDVVLLMRNGAATAGLAGGSAQAGWGILGLLIGLFAIVQRRGVRRNAPVNGQAAWHRGRNG